MPASLGELATEFGCDLIGDPDTHVDRVATLANASPQSIGFLANPAYRNQLQTTKAAAVVLAETDAEDCPVAALISTDPYATYARIAGVLHPPEAHAPGIHPSAEIDASASVSDTAHVSANVVIGEECSIGDGVYIAAGCVIGKRCSIGRDSQLLANATLVKNVKVGERTVIHPGAIVGKMVIPEEQLSALILAQPGETFNLRRLTQSKEFMEFRLGEQGYSNAEIDPVPTLDHENKEVSVTFYVDPQSRVYVRRIVFKNIDQVDDKVLRREMRQAEGAFLSNRLVERSKVRLQRLPYLERVEVENVPVPGSPDMVDVEFDIEYRMPGQDSL